MEDYKRCGTSAESICRLMEIGWNLQDDLGKLDNQIHNFRTSFPIYSCPLINPALDKLKEYCKYNLLNEGRIILSFPDGEEHELFETEKKTLEERIYNYFPTLIFSYYTDVLDGDNWDKREEIPFIFFIPKSTWSEVKSFESDEYHMCCYNPNYVAKKLQDIADYAMVEYEREKYLPDFLF